MFKNLEEMPLRTSIKEISFSAENGYVLMKIRYDVNTIEVVPNVNPIGNVLRKAQGKKFSSHEILIPLMNLKEGEGVYEIYKELLTMVNSIVNEAVGPDVINEEEYKKRLTKLIKKHKEEFPDAELREQAGIFPPGPVD